MLSHGMVTSLHVNVVNWQHLENTHMCGDVYWLAALGIQV